MLQPAPQCKYNDRTAFFFFFFQEKKKKKKKKKEGGGETPGDSTGGEGKKEGETAGEGKVKKFSNLSAGLNMRYDTW